MLTYDEVLHRVDALCKARRMAQYPYKAPECTPGIESNQVKALIEVVVQLFNEKESHGT